MAAINGYNKNVGQPDTTADGDEGWLQTEIGGSHEGGACYIPSICSRRLTARVMSSAKRLWSRRKSGRPSERSS